MHGHQCRGTSERTIVALKRGHASNVADTKPADVTSAPSLTKSQLQPTKDSSDGGLSDEWLAVHPSNACSDTGARGEYIGCRFVSVTQIFPSRCDSHGTCGFHAPASTLSRARNLRPRCLGAQKAVCFWPFPHEAVEAHFVSTFPEPLQRVWKHKARIRRRLLNLRT